MEVILKTIDKALKDRQLSDAAASYMAVGYKSLLKNMRASKGKYSYEAVAKLAHALDLELYFGPPREFETVQNIEIEGADYLPINIVDAALSAGSGQLNSGEETIGHLAFRKDWLMKMGIKPNSASLVRIEGTSMEPTLDDGSLVMVDHLRTDQVGKSVFAIEEDGFASVKRLERIDTKTLLIMSDNPDHPNRVLTGNAINTVRVIGQVVWSAKTWNTWGDLRQHQP